MSPEFESIEAPALFYGTAWKESKTGDCVTAAIESGFRAIDTANQRKHYHEAAVGAALQAAFDRGTLKRGDLFLQTKFTSLGGQDHRVPYRAQAPVTDQVTESFASSLEHLHTDYLDSYVLHGPSLYDGLADEDWEAWRAMETLLRAGKARTIGVSNVSVQQLRLLCDGCAVRPAFVQNRCFARNGWDQSVRRYCTQQGIRYQGFSLLTANAIVLRNARFVAIAATKRCTPEQLVFAFAAASGMIALTGTTDRNHMRADLEAPNVTLTPEEAGLIEVIAAGYAGD